MADSFQKEGKQGRVLNPHTRVYLHNIFTTKGSYVNPAKWKYVRLRYANLYSKPTVLRYHGSYNG
jgi:hypothetical protein